MLKSQLFIATHGGSGGSMLVDMLTAYPSIGKLQRKDGSSLTDLVVLNQIQKESQKYKPTSRMFVDKLSFNFELSHNDFYDKCSFVFFVRSAEDSLNNLVKYYLYKPDKALSYYCFRLRRLCEMAKKINNKIILTWDDLVDKSGIDSLKTFLKMRELTSFYKHRPIERVVDPSLVRRGQKCYEKHLAYLRRVSANPPGRS